MRLAKVACVAAMAFYATLVAFGNVTDYGTNFAFVEHVFRMDTIFPDATIRYRAIDVPWVWTAGVIGGLACGFLLWQVAFMSIGGEWFGMWQSQTWNGVASAARIFMMLIAVLIFVSLPDSEIEG
nr:DUF2165 domain-containing protein [Paradevosia shaoguanensis]